MNDKKDQVMKIFNKIHRIDQVTFFMYFYKEIFEDIDSGYIDDDEYELSP